MRAPRRRSRGLTLLEVLVAVGLIAGGGLATMRLVRMAVRTAAAEDVQTSALFAVMDELARVRLHPPAPGETTRRLADGLTLERRVRATLHPTLLEVRVRAIPPGATTGIEIVEIVRAAVS